MSNISDLILQRGQIDANARLGSAQAKMGAIQGVANTISSTIADIPRRRAQALQDESSRIDLANKKITHETLKKGQADDKTYDEIMGKHTKPDTLEVDYQGAARELISKGLVKQSQEVQSLWNQSRTAKANEIKAQVEQFDKRLGQSRTLWRGITDQASLDRMRPALEATMGPELSKHIPAVYDKAAIDQLSVWGADAKEAIDWQNFALDSAKKSFELKKGTQEQLQKEKESWSAWVATTGSQQEYDDAMKRYTAEGWSPNTVAMFGSTWSPDVKKKATEFAIGAKELANNAIQVRGQNMQGGDAAQRARENDINTANKWREDQMLKLRDKMRTPVETVGPTGRTVWQPAMTPAEYEKEQRWITESHQRMLDGIGGVKSSAAPNPDAAAPVVYKFTQTRVINGATVEAGSNDGVNWTRIK